MRIPPKFAKRITAALALVAILFVGAVRAQDKDAGSKGKSDSTSNTVRLTIVVTGGEEKLPVDNASVYVRYIEERKVIKDKKIEMNLKTNTSGICHVLPEIPKGKFTIQVIADGWKTFGEVYESNQDEQTINISLVRPPKWY